MNGGNNSFTLNTTGPFCFVTCNDLKHGWGCDSFTTTTRSITVNGSAVSCGGALPARKPEGYYYFEIGAGGHTYDGIHWAGTTATSCTAPAGGWSP